MMTCACRECGTLTYLDPMTGPPPGWRYFPKEDFLDEYVCNVCSGPPAPPTWHNRERG
jgi:hypothetical protein